MHCNKQNGSLTVLIITQFLVIMMLIMPEDHNWTITTSNAKEIHYDENMLADMIWNTSTNNIFQTYTLTPRNKNKYHLIKSWRMLNTDWIYHHFDDINFNNYMALKFSELMINNDLYFVEKVDIFRYQILYEYGGVYADVDVECKIPINSWKNVYGYNDSKVDMIIGIEIPISWSNLLTFVQWTFASFIKQNPILKYVVNQIKNDIIYKKQKKTLKNVVKRTGPIAFTKYILNWISMHPKNKSEIGWNDQTKLPNILNPYINTSYTKRLNDKHGQLIKLFHIDYGDINLLILPYRAFGMHLKPHNHTMASRDKTQQLVRHQFHGSWYKNKTRKQKRYKKNNQRQSFQQNLFHYLKNSTLHNSSA